MTIPQMDGLMDRQMQEASVLGLPESAQLDAYVRDCLDRLAAQAE